MSVAEVILGYPRVSHSQEGKGLCVATRGFTKYPQVLALVTTNT